MKIGFIIAAILALVGCSSGSEERKLLNAAAAGDALGVKAELAKGADVNCRDDSLTHWTPLLWAIYEDREDIVVMLLSAGADPNYRDSTGHYAIDLAKSAEVREVLIKSGAHGTSNGISQAGSTP